MRILNPKDRDLTDQTEEYLNKFIGVRVRKNTKNPFKSGFMINTVTGVIISPYTNRYSFTFKEDDSFVECFRCVEVETTIRRGL